MARVDKNKARFKFTSYDHELLDKAVAKIVDRLKKAGLIVVGPVPLPTERHLYCVIKSPHKDKDSREHFEMKVHKRLIDIYDERQIAMEEMKRISIPAGVEVNVDSRIHK